MTTTNAAPITPRLSIREAEILRSYLLLGTALEVARSVYVAPCTVSTHLTRIRRKYDDAGRPARSKTELLVRALQDGLVTLDDFDRAGG